MSTPQQFLELAAAEAMQGMRRNHGGPFGAVIVRDGRIIAKAHNQVLKSQDPTAHAEILAIRRAAKKLRRFDLSDCTIYSSCEPCPMCLAAIVWAKISTLYYGCSRDDAARLGFDDAAIYHIIRGEPSSVSLKMQQIERAICLQPFQEWLQKPDRQIY